MQVSEVWHLDDPGKRAQHRTSVHGRFSRREDPLACIFFVVDREWSLNDPHQRKHLWTVVRLRTTDEASWHSWLA